MEDVFFYKLLKSENLRRDMRFKKMRLRAKHINDCILIKFEYLLLILSLVCRLKIENQEDTIK